MNERRNVMDNRTDMTEDQQSTPEHLAGQVGGPATGQPLDPRMNQQAGSQQAGQPVSGLSRDAGGTGLSAGPHNEALQSSGIEDTYQRPESADRPSGKSNEQSLERSGRDSMSARMKTFTHTLTGNPLPWFIGAAGLLLLALRRARRR
jgi:hypothetical protein